MILIQITAPHLCAAICADRRGGVVVRAAPIVKYMLGWDGPKVASYCKRRGWRFQALT